jgi:hypothetical protein
MNHQSEPNQHSVQGISAYREVTNTEFQPHFRVSLPSNWILSYKAIPKEKANWLAFAGPRDQSFGRNTTLSVLVKEANDTGPTLEEFAQNTIQDKMAGNFSTEFIRPASISGERAMEIKINSETANPFTFKQGHDKHQWVVIQHDRYFVTIRFSASEEFFDKFADAFNKAIESFTFLK